MADIQIEGTDLVVVLTALEKAEALHGDLRIPLDAITAVEVVDDAMRVVSGIRLLGTGLPGVVRVGTFVGGERVFAVVHRDARRGVRITLSSGGYAAIVVGCADPEGVASAIEVVRSHAA